MVSFSAERSPPTPYGTQRVGDLTFFSLQAHRVYSLRLHLFEPGKETPFLIQPFDPQHNRTGEVWHLAIKNLPEAFDYGYQIDSAESLVVDPYALHLNSPRTWGEERSTNFRYLAAHRPPKFFDWQGVGRPRLPSKELCVYEMHVRGFTADPSSRTKHPGTFLGLIEKIDHLKRLGVNAVELLPIFEFDETSYNRTNPKTGEQLCQYWGYAPLHFFAPMGRYAAGLGADDPAHEFRTLVRELHRAGIEVILDVVYNHVGDSHYFSSLKHLYPTGYFILENGIHDTNYTGCGNTLNANHPVCQQLILSSLRYWFLQMGVDGFRFDLAAALTRAPSGEPLNYAPLIEAIGLDPLLSEVKLIAEPWDCAGLYNLGNFGAPNPRWIELNGKYRDDTRRFMKGLPDYTTQFATRLSGSEDLYGNRSPTNSLNFITSHDGFSLTDLVSYNTKHNNSNGEGNRDGSSHNDSWNCGVEGDTSETAILELRERQRLNFLAALLLSQGIPLLRMGDEYGHTQLGNNNSWCQDNRISWFCWDTLEKEERLFGYARKLVVLRKQVAELGKERFLTPRDITWHDANGLLQKWKSDAPFIAFTLLEHGRYSEEPAPILYAAFNMQATPQEVTLPLQIERGNWHYLLNTSSITEPEERIFVSEQSCLMKPHSCLVAVRGND